MAPATPVPFFPSRTRNTSTIWISCKNKHTNSDWHEPAQLNHQPNDMIQIEHSRISEAYPAEKAVVELPSIVAWAGFFGIVRGLMDRLQEGLT